MTRGEDQIQQMELQSPNPTSMEIWIVDGQDAGVCKRRIYDIPLRRVDTYMACHVDRVVVSSYPRMTTEIAHGFRLSAFGPRPRVVLYVVASTLFEPVLHARCCVFVL